MKKTLLSLIIFISIGASGQGADTIVTSLQLKAGTIKLIAGASQFLNEDNIHAFLKWNSYFRANSPADNANVTIDTAYTVQVAKAYDVLLNLQAGLTEASGYILDFKTSVQSKRTTNSYLDQLMDAIELSFTTNANVLLTVGQQKLLKKYN